MRIKRKLALMLTAVMIVSAIPIMNIQATGGSSSQNDGRSAPLNETVVGFTKEAPHSHSYSSRITRQPTCTASGRRTFTCRDCGYSYYTTISATGHTEVTVPGTAATCTETGLTDGKKCSACGTVTVEQTIIPVTEHKYVKNTEAAGSLVSEADCVHNAVYKETCSECGTAGTGTFEVENTATGIHNYGAGGICKSCGKIENGTSGFSGSSLTLKEGVTSNLSLKVENSEDVAYVSFKSAQIESKVPFDAAAEKDGKYVVSIPVRPDQMTEVIKAQVVYKDGTTGGEIDYTVASTLEGVKKIAGCEELADSIMNFGAYSQLYTGNNTDKLVKEVKDYEKNAEIDSKYEMKRTGSSDLVKFSSASLRINANTAIRVGTTIAAGTKASDYKFACVDSNGNNIDLVSEVSGNKVYISIRDIRPQDLDEIYTFTATDSKGETVTLNYSAFTYIKSQLESGKADKKLTNLLNAMVDYSNAAKAYANK